MPGNLSNVAENQILDHINGVATMTVTPPMKITLSSQVPTDAGISPITGATKPITFTAAVNGSASNSTSILFPNMPGNVYVRGFGVYDSTDKLIWAGPATTERYMTAGDSYEIPAGQLIVTLD